MRITLLEMRRKLTLSVSICSAIVAVVVVIGRARAAEPTVYITEYGGRSVKSASFGGSVNTLYSGTTRLGGLDVDVLSGHVYFLDPDADVIRRMDLNGSDLTSVLTITPDSGAQTTLRDIALDLTSRRMYFTDGTDFGHVSKISRANLDGSGLQLLTTDEPNSGPTPIDLDLAHGKMYWTDYVNDEVLRANIDGTNVEVILSNTYTSGLALDVGAGKMYMSRRSPPGVIGPFTYDIISANLDGSGVTPIVSTGLTDPRGVALDLAAHKGYVADLGAGAVYRFNLDGTGALQTVASGLNQPLGVALPEPFGLSCLGLLACMGRRRRWRVARTGI